MRQPRITSTAAGAMLDALGNLANSGWLRLYAGERPTSPLAAPQSEPLAELRLSEKAFAPAIGFTLTANRIADDQAALGGGTVTWCRVFGSSGTEPLWDGDAGGADTCLEIKSPTINKGQRVNVVSMVISMKQPTE